MPAAPRTIEESTETCDQEKHHEGDRYKSKVMVPAPPRPPRSCNDTSLRFCALTLPSHLPGARSSDTGHSGGRASQR